MTLRINVITNNEHPDSRAFNCPLLATRSLFASSGFDLRFRFSSEASRVFDADILFINSHSFRNELAKDRSHIYKFLEEAAHRHLKIFWFDTTESSCCNHFDVLPYVDCLMKGQMLADRSQYLKGFRTGTPYTDYFDSLYKCSEPEVSWPLPDPAHMHKLALSWNSCFEDYNESRFKLPGRLRQRLRRFTAYALEEHIELEFSEVSEERPVNISCRVGPPSGMPSHIAHRKAIAGKLRKMGADTSMIPPGDYFDELRRAKLSIGPFGNGEISFRDYEAIICGAALLKPDIGHMETWPELFQLDRTFLSFSWDLSDLEAKIESLLEHPAMRTRIAWEAQEVYRHAISPQGLSTFVGRMVCAIESRI
jgi:hypothetical protein